MIPVSKQEMEIKNVFEQCSIIAKDSQLGLVLYFDLVILIAMSSSVYDCCGNVWDRVQS